MVGMVKNHANLRMFGMFLKFGTYEAADGPVTNDDNFLDLVSHFFAPTFI
jgi:hypothetical protein